MKKATLIKDLPCNESNSTQALYELDPPLEGFQYVVASAVVAMFSGPETYLFGSDEEGEITEWGELEGSYRGGMSHEEALSGAGYEVFSEEDSV